MSKRVYEKGRSHCGTPISSWIQENLQYDSESYCNRNGIEARIERTENAFGCLIEKLMDKGLLSQPDVLDIVGMNQYDGARDTIEIRESEGQ